MPNIKPEQRGRVGLCLHCCLAGDSASEMRSKEGCPRGDGDEEDNDCPCLMTKGVEGGKVIYRVSPLDRKSPYHPRAQGAQVSPGHLVPNQEVLGHSLEQIWSEPPRFTLSPDHRNEDFLSAFDLTPVASQTILSLWALLCTFWQRCYF